MAFKWSLVASAPGAESSRHLAYLSRIAKSAGQSLDPAQCLPLCGYEASEPGDGAHRHGDEGQAALTPMRVFPQRLTMHAPWKPKAS
ncbi:MAG: hypothetical protein IH627_14410 [Rubrivivax sp.]|nr:hypothetical protein [Rubrivivax sp.]